MISPISCLKIIALTGVLLVAPLRAAEPASTGQEKIQVSQGTALDPDDPLHQWFKSQDKLLDEILVRIARIEHLVQALHQLVVKLPGPTPTPPAPPVTKSSTADIGILAGGGLLAIVPLFLWLRRKRAATPTRTLPAPKTPARPASVSAAPAPPVPVPPTPTSAPIIIDQNDQALELADIMLSMGLGHGAAQTLVEQIRREPRQALLHWLKLLEIYRKEGQQEEFERSAEELRRHFNVQPEDWHARPDVQRSLEDYPHIASRVATLWKNKPACLDYLQSLLDDNRGGARAGFPRSVAEELVLLSTLLKNAED